MSGPQLVLLLQLVALAILVGAICAGAFYANDIREAFLQVAAAFGQFAEDQVADDQEPAHRHRSQA